MCRLGGDEHGGGRDHDQRRGHDRRVGELGGLAGLQPRPSLPGVGDPEQLRSKEDGDRLAHQGRGPAPSAVQELGCCRVADLHPAGHLAQRQVLDHCVPKRGALARLKAGEDLVDDAAADSRQLRVAGGSGGELVLGRHLALAPAAPEQVKAVVAGHDLEPGTRVLGQGLQCAQSAHERLLGGLGGLLAIPQDSVAGGKNEIEVGRVEGGARLLVAEARGHAVPPTLLADDHFGHPSLFWG